MAVPACRAPPSRERWGWLPKAVLWGTGYPRRQSTGAQPPKGSSSIWQSTGLQNRRLGVRVPPALLLSASEVAVNRQMKRLMQRQGQVGEDGSPVRQRPQQPRQQPRQTKEKTSPAEFFRQVRAELRKVAWPGRAEVINYSIIV